MSSPYALQHVVASDASSWLCGELVCVCVHLILQIQRFVASADATENSSGREEVKRESLSAGSRRVANTDAKVIAAGGEAGREWAPEVGRKPDRTQGFATVVVQELRKGVDVGSIAAARAQAIRR